MSRGGEKWELVGVHHGAGESTPVAVLRHGRTTCTRTHLSDAPSCHIASRARASRAHGSGCPSLCRGCVCVLWRARVWVCACSHACMCAACWGRWHAVTAADVDRYGLQARQGQVLGAAMGHTGSTVAKQGWRASRAIARPNEGFQHVVPPAQKAPCPRTTPTCSFCRPAASPGCGGPWRFRDSRETGLFRNLRAVA